jgi:hypothetical protein
MNRAVIAALAGLFTFGGVYGLAASLNLTTDGLGAATDVVAGCQAAAMTASYTTTYSASASGYVVSTVTVSGLAATCYAKAYRIALAGSGGTSLGEVTGTTPSSGSTFAATFSPAVSATSVAGLSVVISG